MMRNPLPSSIDLVVGIPSYNSASTIGNVIEQVAQGLARYFPEEDSLIVVSDGNSTDGTLEVARWIRLPQRVLRMVTLYPGVPGKGSALLHVLGIAERLDAKAVSVVDSDLRSIRPEWMQLLLQPILDGKDLVAPHYLRHKYDGTITNNIAYPMTRALYGKRVRQPIGGDFGISRRLTKTLLGSRLISNEYTPRFGIDVFITHTALHERLEVVEAALGSKVHAAKNPSAQLGSMFGQVTGSMFSCMIEYEDVWRQVHGSEPIPLVKSEFEFPKPEPVHVDLAGCLAAHKNGLMKHGALLKHVLPGDLCRSLTELPDRPEEFNFPMELWARIVYTFAAAFKKMQGAIEKEGLLSALEACWIGRVASFVRETLEWSDLDAEEKVIEDAATFEDEKSYLLGIY
jgi:hypothetical protein